MKPFNVTVLFPQGTQSYVRYGFDIVDIQRMEEARYQTVNFISLTIEEA